MDLRPRSSRERRLWLWTTAVVAAIYSTLWLAEVLAQEFRRRDIIDAAFGWGFVLILLAIAALGLKLRPRGLEIGVALGVVAVYGLVLVRMAVPEERSHVVEYGVVAILVHEALVERWSSPPRSSEARSVPARAPGARLHGARSWAAVGSALGLTIGIGAVDELIQLLIPSRVFDVRDIFTNSVSAVMALLAKLSLGWASCRGRR